MTGFISSILIAIVVTAVATTIAKEKFHNGFWSALPIGILGAWIGAYLPFFKTFGSVVDGAAIIPSIIGCALFIGILGFFKDAISEMSV